jgi:hypothetical protein
MHKLRAFLILLAMAGGGVAAGSQSANARTYDECVAAEKKKLEYALPGESSTSIQNTAETLCGGRPKERGAGYQPSKKRAQKLLTQDSCMSAKKKGFKCCD